MMSALEKIVNHGKTKSEFDIRGTKIGLRLLSEEEYHFAVSDCAAEVAKFIGHRNVNTVHGRTLTLDLMIRELMTQVISRAAFDPESGQLVFGSPKDVREEITRPDRNKLIDSYQTLEQQFQAGQKL